MVVSVTDTELYVSNLHRRMTFHFGNVHVAEGPQVLLDATIDVNGDSYRGVAMGALAPMWFYKDPDLTMESGVAAMLEVFGVACDEAEALSSAESAFECWRLLYDAVESWAAETDHPDLLWSYGVSLVEQAVIDAYCRATKTSFPDAVHEEALGIDLSVIYEELDGESASDLLPDTPLSQVDVRHTVGLSDPLTDDDVGVDNRLDDGLPQTLSEYVVEQDISHFKIKLAAKPSDIDRLRRIQKVVETHLDDYAFTLDANEQYPTVTAFREQWEQMAADDDLAEFFEHLRYVEQPLPRDEAFSERTREAFEAWENRPPVIIDESDDSLDSLQRALSSGYNGTSHKNCKGVFKGIANRCLLEYRRREDGGRYLMSGEDLTTLGPIELQEDLAVMSTLGMKSVERNGHHYYRGLSMLPEDVQEQILDVHPDLFARHPDGFPTLDVQGGKVSLDSVLTAPFGHQIDLDTDDPFFIPAAKWSLESIYA